MKVIKLVGHSGCPLILEKKNGKYEVKKISKNKDYNDRLKAQHRKQNEFSHNIFLTPEILDSQTNEDGLFEFNMEYVNGVKMAEYLDTVSISSLSALVDVFKELIPKENAYDPEASNIFNKKIKDLKDNIKDTGIIREAMRLLEGFDWKYCMSNTCHGDLTLENIIVSDGKYYLIDFLDSFYESWMIDYAKLLQDLECFWSYRHLEEMDENLKIRLSIFKKILTKSILELPDGKELLKTIYCILLLNLVRIIPYTKDEKTSVFLDREMQKVINKIKLL